MKLEKLRKDDTWQRSAKALPLFVFLFGHLKASYKARGEDFFLCLDFRQTQRGKKNGPFDQPCKSNWAQDEKNEKDIAGTFCDDGIVVCDS